MNPNFSSQFASFLQYLKCLHGHVAVFIAIMLFRGTCSDNRWFLNIISSTDNQSLTDSGFPYARRSGEC
uniref:Uncharacterized protein n=1 Tax=Candidatus Kentrum sp. TUN TaxID=2126343 RepID=A0A450ZTP8_9GAMM|nr:MAG: hypothetical protein BECKTUN1418D_GA0071000_105916 [Candidatus Kentron sp. TUN]